MWPIDLQWSLKHWSSKSAGIRHVRCHAPDAQPSHQTLLREFRNCLGRHQTCPTVPHWTFLNVWHALPKTRSCTTLMSPATMRVPACPTVEHRTLQYTRVSHAATVSTHRMPSQRLMLLRPASTPHFSEMSLRHNKKYAFDFLKSTKSWLLSTSSTLAQMC